MSSENIYLFANNDNGVAKDLGSYRLYGASIEGTLDDLDTSKVNYVDYIYSDGDSWIGTGIVPKNGYTIETTCMIDEYSSQYMMLYGNNYESMGTNSSSGVGLLTVYHTNYGRYLKWVDQGKGLNDARNQDNIIYDGGSHIGNRFTYSHKIKNTSSIYELMLFGDYSTVLGKIESCCNNTVRIYDFKIYDDKDALILHLRPCIGSNGSLCMYDEVSRTYFHNRGVGSFGYKTTLRDFVPVIDKNNVPCLMDKINRKYYYNKGTGNFGTNISKEGVNYKIIPYIQGDGIAYIDTGIYANAQYKYEIEFDISIFGSYYNLFGSDSTECRLLLNSNGNGSLFDYKNVSLSSSGFVAGEKTKVVIDKNKYYINNELKITATETNDTTAFNYSTWIFKARYLGRTDERPSKMKLYSFKMWNENDELVFDGIPVLDENDIPCLYDKATSTFFYGEGDGEIIYPNNGYECECPPVDYVEYLDNNGSTTYKLGIVSNVGDIIGVKYKCMFTDNTKNGQTSILSTTDGVNGGSGWIYYQPALGGTDFYTRNGWGNGQETYTMSTPWERNKIYEIECNATSNKIIVNGVEMCETTTTPQPHQYYDLYLFSNAINYSISNIRFYYIDVYKNYELVGSFRPAIDENGEVCLYNSITQKYIYKYVKNAMVDVGSLPYTPVKYLESDGTQYIDTEVSSSMATKLKMKCTVRDVLSNGNITNKLSATSTYKYNSTDTTVESKVKSAEKTTLTLTDTWGSYLTNKEILSAYVNGWKITNTNLPIITADLDVNTLVTNTSISQVCIELTQDNYKTRLDQVLAYYPNCTNLYLVEDGSVTSLKLMCYGSNNANFKKQIRKVTFVDGFFTNLTNLSEGFYECSSLAEVENLPNTITEMYMCFYKTALVSPPIMPRDTIGMEGCFQGCILLTEAPVIPDKVTKMANCFSGCTSLKSSPNIPNDVTSLKQCFQGCSSLVEAPVIPNKVTNMENCFNGCTVLTTVPNIPNSVTSMGYCFRDCRSLVTIDTTNWDTSSITNLSGLFYGCSGLIKINGIENWNVSNVTNVWDLFFNCGSLTNINLSSWDMSKMNSTGCMYRYCGSLKTAYLPIQGGTPNNALQGCSSDIDIVWVGERSSDFNIGTYSHSKFREEDIKELVPEHLKDLYKDTISISFSNKSVTVNGTKTNWE